MQCINFKEMYLIFCAGGIEEFRNKHLDLCDSSIKSQEARPLYSPTTPIIEPQIETATASQILPFLYLGKFPFFPRKSGNIHHKNTCHYHLTSKCLFLPRNMYWHLTCTRPQEIYIHVWNRQEEIIWVVFLCIQAMKETQPICRDFKIWISPTSSIQHLIYPSTLKIRESITKEYPPQTAVAKTWSSILKKLPHLLVCKCLTSTQKGENYIKINLHKRLLKIEDVKSLFRMEKSDKATHFWIF